MNAKKKDTPETKQELMTPSIWNGTSLTVTGNDEVARATAKARQAVIVDFGQVAKGTWHALVSLTE